MQINRKCGRACVNYRLSALTPLRSFGPTQRHTITSKQQVVDWVVQSNKLLDSKKEIFRKCFLVCGISNALDGSRNHFIRCAKELSDVAIAYGLEKSVDTDSGSESDDPFDSDSDKWK